MPSLVVADLSFISLRLVLPALTTAAEEGAELVLLVKPQFEAGRKDVGTGGVVRDPAVWRSALEGVTHMCHELGLGVDGVMPSPLLGPAGNVEFLLHAVDGRKGSAPDLEAVLSRAETLRADR
jgi:23S rRNA (cytidine1920-2'-O)/16S rRNA (cytidine1409-2'-O)-methyltransferase